MVETNRKQAMKRRLTRWLWWAAFITSVILTLTALPGYVLKLSESELSSGFGTIQQAALWLGILLSVGSALLCLALALLVFIKRPGEPMAMFLSFFLLVFGILMAGPLELFASYWFPQSVVLVQLLQSTVFPIFGLALILVFPNGHFNPRWTRWLLVVSLFLNIYIFLPFNMGELVGTATTRTQAGSAVMGALVLFGMANQVYRYRRMYSLIERQQTKWVLIGLAAMLFLGAIVSIPYKGELSWNPLSALGWLLSLIIFPASLTIAVLRYRLFNIDVIIRRTLVYGALTATLALVFFGGVVLLQQLISGISGTQNSPVAIVISTLVIAALFSPLRNRIQRDIDRRFYRKKYNAQKTLESFAASLRDEVELEDLTSRLLAVVQETMQPEEVNFWLKSIKGFETNRKEQVRGKVNN